jgi:hypothetical protein
VKWGALPFPPPPPFRVHPTSARHAKGRGGGGARKVRAPQCAPLPPGSPRVQRGEDSLFAHVANWGALPTCTVRALPLCTGHVKGGHNPPSPPFMRQDSGGLHVPPSPRNWAGSAGTGAPPLAYEGNAQVGLRAIPEAAGQPHTTGQGPREREGCALLRLARLCANPRPSSPASVTVHTAGGGKRKWAPLGCACVHVNGGRGRRHGSGAPGVCPIRRWCAGEHVDLDKKKRVHSLCNCIHCCI